MKHRSDSGPDGPPPVPRFNRSEGNGTVFILTAEKETDLFNDSLQMKELINSASKGLMSSYLLVLKVRGGSQQSGCDPEGCGEIIRQLLMTIDGLFYINKHPPAVNLNSQPANHTAATFRLVDVVETT